MSSQHRYDVLSSKTKGHGSQTFFEREDKGFLAFPSVWFTLNACSRENGEEARMAGERGKREREREREGMLGEAILSRQKRPPKKMESRFSAVSFLSVLFRSLLFFIQISFQPSSFLLGHFRRGSLMLLYEGAL